MGVVDFAAEKKRKGQIAMAEKKRLISRAFELLHAAEGIDERKGPEPPEGWVAWYDAAIADLREIQRLADEMGLDSAPKGAAS